MRGPALWSEGFCMAVASVALSMAPVLAQPPAQALVGTWLVTIAGEPETRTLVIAEEAASNQGALLAAKYGITGKGIGAVEARMVRNGSTRELQLTTQAASRIAAAEQPDGAFRGTFTFKNGNGRDVVITRIDPNDPRLAQVSATSGIQKPGPDVPPGCAAFSGGWGGEWPVAGQAYLWVMSVDAGCMARVAYNKNPQPPNSTQGLTAVNIKGNTLSLPRPDGGTTTFELRGDTLDGRYAGPAGFNNATMQRVTANSPDAARAAADASAASAMIPPSADTPADCAALFGQWVGVWGQGSIAEMFLRVAEIKVADGKCVARYSYSTSKSPVPARSTAEVSAGTLKFVCNQSTGGTCYFNGKGDGTLAASYSNPAGGVNAAVFKRVP